MFWGIEVGIGGEASAGLLEGFEAVDARLLEVVWWGVCSEGKGIEVGLSFGPKLPF